MISLRAPNKDEHEALTDLCIRAKAHWGYDDDFMAMCAEEMTITASDITSGYFQVAERGGNLVGVASIAPCNDGIEVDLIYVDPDHMGTGAGRKLMDWAMDAARAMNADELIIVADPHAETFYTHIGAARVGEYPSGSIPGRMLPKLILKL
ncbi:MAG: GNAT family N-acetyltransferase [Rhodospirillales bacterium]|jgi:GNAT superfamily N-acetyltransferase|nr:GNAT family N-acetyltransferase [Rhodospirillales bacterium]MBT4040352.1 GNAT family N-acetyltransferase [Rhodospirillales bacterium]MBT4625079.1 GNAT family N-acetyltransferase [Rhodospirillales bacterium]MBT5353208.1 GNAT family N-acetyltransferase [Rhodospirillales bacterium]MBT5519370.1 GNAT family N-acetyltransferase [Rhodospirillales bacterium]